MNPQALKDSGHLFDLAADLGRGHAEVHRVARNEGRKSLAREIIEALERGADMEEIEALCKLEIT